MSSDDRIPRVIDIDAEPTGANEDRPSRGKTTPHASVDWMAGYDEGLARGSAEILEALEAALVSVGVGEDVAKTIVARVRARAEKTPR
ncbi:MAG TPA: hypothetical protein VHL80_11095 [Polyangia bacterium]|nr:hypothetical protein [Polyangia bacterium]